MTSSDRGPAKAARPDSLPFLKMEGCGNDYVYIDLEEAAGEGLDPVEILREAPSLARSIADRRFGVGGDGLVLIEDPAGEARMHMFNLDGSRGATCGNALRCVGLHRRRLVAEDAFVLRSDAGMSRTRVLAFEGRSGTISVEMGVPRFEAEAIPFLPGRVPWGRPRGGGAEPWRLALPLDLGKGEERLEGRALSVGNPHLVLLVPGTDPIGVEAVARIGRELERAPCFPDRVNVSFLRREGDELVQETWERGSGRTLACGSGACACLVAAVDAGWAEVGEEVAVRLPGGGLRLHWSEAGMLTMTGPARLVATGRFFLGTRAGEEGG